MVLSFLYKYIDEDCEIPQQMLDENIRVDYNKLRMLIRKDKEFAHDASIIQTLVSQGFVTGELKEGFPAENIAKNDNFISLLYYFGLVTIGGFYQVTPDSRSPMRWFANRFLHISSKPMKKMTSHSRVMTSARRNN